MNIAVISSFALMIISFYMLKNADSGVHKARDFVWCAFTTLVVVITFDVCPLRGGIFDGDSSVFVYIARMMQRGAVPYRDVFDHKGPWLYFIEYVGLLGGYSGIWVLEIINLFATSWATLKISRLYSSDYRAGYLTVFGVVFVLGMNFYMRGNYTEFWALPWISVSLYYFLKFIEKKDYSKGSVVFIGAAFMITFLLRCNLIACWVVFVPAMIFYLIILKRHREVLLCSVLFLSGALLALIPVLVYYGINNALTDLYECYWIYNLFYVDSSGNLETAMLVFFDLGKYLMIGWISLIPMVIKMRTRSMIHLIHLVVTFGLTLMSSRYFEHYYISVLPCFIVPVCIMFDRVLVFKKGQGGKRWFKGLGISLLTAAICICVGSTVYFHIIKNWDKRHLDTVMLRYVAEHTDPDDDVFFTSGNGMWNLLSDRYTEQKYFYLFPVSYNDILLNAFLDDMHTNPPDYVFITSSDDNKVLNGIRGVCEDLGYQKDEQINFCVYSSPGSI